MLISIYWDNYSRSLIDRGEFGKGISFKRKLGFRPAVLRKQVEITMPDTINLTWKRMLEEAINGQFQMNMKATIYITNGAVKHSGFVISARNPKEFSNKTANGFLRIKAKETGKLSIENIIDEGYTPHKRLA